MSPPAQMSREEAAIAQANANLAAMADDYVRWATKDLAHAVEQVKALKSDPDKEAQRIIELFKNLHNIKGHGGTFGYDLITAVAAIACNILRERKTISEDARAVLERCVQLMAITLDKRVRGRGGEKGAKLLDKLQSQAAPYF